MTGGKEASAGLRLLGVRKNYGAVTALSEINLTAGRGEFLTVLGPSGSGKTTMLKIVAGFEYPDAGSVLLEGRDISFLRPARRNIGMVFQNYALFPHMSVAQNVAFPLRMRRVSRAEIRRRVMEVLDLVALGAFADRLPSQLSGGQQQRVALARAVVFDPPLLLLDEPFGALDRKLREQMQLEVKRLQQRLGITAVFVTHDQEEALVLSDRIAVMNEGEIQQIAPPEELYQHPSNRFVADFIGESTLLTGRVIETNGQAMQVEAGGVQLRVLSTTAHAPGDRVHLMIRPERPRPLLAGEEAENLVEGQITEAIFVGESRKYRIALAQDQQLLVRWPLSSVAGPLTPGDRVRVEIPANNIHVVAD